MTEACRTTVESSLPGHDHLRGQLVDTINHELRTPLATLLGHTELLQDLDLDLPEAAKHSLGAIVRAGERLLDLADTVSEIIGLEHPAYDVSRQRIALVSLARQVVAGTTSRAAARSITVELTGPQAQVFGMVDDALVKAALDALLDNALSHAPDGSDVEV